MTTLGAVHVHSTYSHDGRDSLPDLHAFAASRGLGFIGLTDHAEDFDADVFARFTAECRAVSATGPRLIPGLEFRFAGLKGLHLLALGLTRWIEPATPDEFIAMTRGVTGLTIAAHPILAAYSYPPSVLEGIDAFEVWNASYNTRYLPDPRAIRLLAMVRRTRPAAVAVAGLDQHDARNDRETRVEVFDDGDPLAAIRAGRFRNIGRTMSFDAHAGLGPVRGAALWTARTLFDGVERVQDRAARWLAARRKS
jgi:predicted metal-dependent phosphoesterase TrpH